VESQSGKISGGVKIGYKQFVSDDLKASKLENCDVDRSDGRFSSRKKTVKTDF
jgi:hypothetical protein